MKNTPSKYGSIQEPCSMDWNAMQSTQNSSERFCQYCQKGVKDISELSEIEIRNSLKESDLCIRATTKQVSVPFAPIKRFGKLGLLVFGLFNAQQSPAQIFSSNSSYSFEQAELKSDTISLKGVIKGERKLKIRQLRIEHTIGYKQLHNVTISIFSEEDLLILGAYPDEHGKFEILVDRRLLGKNFSILIDDKSDAHYDSIEISTIETKDTSFEFFLKESRYIMGRFL